MVYFKPKYTQSMNLNMAKITFVFFPRGGNYNTL